MTAALIVVAVCNAMLVVALVAKDRATTKERGFLIDEFAAERGHLIDVIVAKHAGELGRLTQARQIETPESPEVAEYKATRDTELRAMGYEPDDVPGLPHGLG